MSESFRAVMIDKDAADKTAPQRVEVTSLTAEDLMDGDVRVAVDYSTLNYKDALAITGAGPVVRRFPMIPGIDLAGTVTHSDNAKFKSGDRVLVNGWGLSETHYGGYAQQARVNSEWLVRVPGSISTAQAMAIGTAGYTAMLCILELEHHGLKPDSGPILVTGATGGVGSVAIAILARLGFHVIAGTGRPAHADYLRDLGARDIIDRAGLAEKGKPLAKQRWIGAVDTVGSTTLANVLAATEYDGVVTACGLAGGGDLPATVMPFILRDVTLAGVDSVMAPPSKREMAWTRLASDLDLEKLDSMSHTIGLDDSIDAARALLAGEVRGRTVVDVNA